MNKQCDPDKHVVSLSCSHGLKDKSPKHFFEHTSIRTAAVSPWAASGGVARGSYGASGRQVGHRPFIVMMSQERLHTWRKGDVSSHVKIHLTKKYVRENTSSKKKKGKKRTN